MSIGLSVALSFGMSLYSRSTGFNLTQLAPIAAIIFIGLIGLVIFSLVNQFGGNSVKSSMIAYIIVYALVRTAFPEIYHWLILSKIGGWLDAAFIIIIPVLLFQLFKEMNIPSLSMDKPFYTTVKDPILNRDEKSEIDIFKRKNKIGSFTVV